MNAVVSSEVEQVLRVRDITLGALKDLLSRFQLNLVLVPDAGRIEGSYWGEPEAGLIARNVYVRPDTPVHSVLHEACHAICMTEERRSVLHRDAGGDDLEESAVCYLQIVLAEILPGVGRRRLMQDRDVWGYSFRLGTTAAWYEQDACDAREWLESQGWLTSGGTPRWELHQT
jgi:hypothetical protein